MDKNEQIFLFKKNSEEIDTASSNSWDNFETSTAYNEMNESQEHQEAEENDFELIKLAATLDTAGNALKQFHAKSTKQLETAKRSAAQNALELEWYKYHNMTLLKENCEMKKELKMIKQLLPNAKGFYTPTPLRHIYMLRAEHDSEMEEQHYMMLQIKAENERLKAAESKDLAEINSLKTKVAELYAINSLKVFEAYDQKLTKKQKKETETTELLKEVQHLKKQLEAEREARKFLINERSKKVVEYQESINNEIQQLKQQLEVERQKRELLEKEEQEVLQPQQQRISKPRSQPKINHNLKDIPTKQQTSVQRESTKGRNPPKLRQQYKIIEAYHCYPGYGYPRY